MRAIRGGGLRVVDGLLLPGKVVGDGRYRLLERVGTDERGRAHLWRARDGQRNRDVALTILVGDPRDPGQVRRAHRTLVRITQPVAFAHSAVARVVNVASLGDGVAEGEGVLGMIAADWTPGTGLTRLVARRPVAPADACRLLEPLADAVRQAHHHGVVLGVGHPSRIRSTPDGLVLAFPGPPAHASLRDDVRGLGAILYLLLTGCWPTGRPAAPRDLRPHVPFELSDVAMRSLDAPAAGGIRTSDTILQVLRTAAADAERTDTIERVGDGSPEPVWITKPPANDPVRKKRLLAGVTTLMVLSLAVVAWIGMTVASVFASDGSASGGPSAVVVPTTTNPVTPAAGANLAQQAAKPVAPAGIGVFNLNGDADSAAKATRTIDGDRSTSWKTDAYLQQFPALKPGIGLLVSFAQPVTVARVRIDSPSAGTQVEIRTSPSANPALADTTVAGTTTLTAGTTTVDLHPTAPTQHVLIWITHLAGTGVHYQSTINELTFIGP